MPTLTIDLPPEIDQPLRAAAEERGQTPEELTVAFLRTLFGSSEWVPSGPAPAAGLDLVAGEERPRFASERRARAYALAGRLAQLPGSVDDFLREKREATSREEARDRGRLQESGE